MDKIIRGGESHWMEKTFVEIQTTRCLWKR